MSQRSFLRRGRLVRQSGAALLLAMIVLTLIATLSASMVWQQARAVQVEAAERARAQVAWMLWPGLDWVGVILKRNATTSPERTQPWDIEVQETRLSALLAADRDNNADTALDAFITGRIEDAQSRYNLRNLVGDDGKLIEAEAKSFARLCQAIGLPGLADRLLPQLAAAFAPPGLQGSATAGAMLEPRRIEDLAWAGLDASTIATLKKFTDILPTRTPVNINTARAEVIVAAIDGIDTATAARLVRQQNNRFGDLAKLNASGLLPQGVQAQPGRLDVRSTHFHVFATMRLEGRVFQEQALLQQLGQGSQSQLRVIWRRRLATAVAPS